MTDLLKAGAGRAAFTNREDELVATPVEWKPAEHLAQQAGSNGVGQILMALGMIVGGLGAIFGGFIAVSAEGDSSILATGIALAILSVIQGALIWAAGEAVGFLQSLATTNVRLVQLNSQAVSLLTEAVGYQQGDEQLVD